MTPDDLRERLRARMTATSPCPTCKGTGTIKPKVTQEEVAAAIGTTRTSVATFLAGRQTFGMAVTLRLIEWLEGKP